jgi:hypothetical protein
MVPKVLAWSSLGMAIVFVVWALCSLAGIVPASTAGSLPLFTVPLIVSILLSIALLVISAFQS